MLKTDRALLEDILEQCLWIRRYGELADAQSPGERSRIVNSGFNAGDIFDTLHFNTHQSLHLVFRLLMPDV